jgi:hypothetical protein
MADDPGSQPICFRVRDTTRLISCYVNGVKKFAKTRARIKSVVSTYKPLGLCLDVRNIKTPRQIAIWSRYEDEEI